MIEKLHELAEKAKAVDLVVVVWSYARGGKLEKEDRDRPRRDRMRGAHGGALQKACHQGETALQPYRPARGEESLRRHSPRAPRRLTVSVSGKFG